MPRRSRQTLEAAAAAASSHAERAQAHYALALFHDNNSREAEAIPHYEAALAHGVAGEQRAECLAWLASSLYKTGRPLEALERLGAARQSSVRAALMQFLAGLERRISARVSIDESAATD